jgi:16S rRNA processing protein RimM
MSQSSRDDLMVLGNIGAAYGIKGWVKINSHTEPKAGIFDYDGWYVKSGRDWQLVKVLASRQHGKGLIAQLEGCNDRNAAELLRNAEIAVESSQLPELAPGEYYWSQLEGLSVVTSDHTGSDCLLGKVSHLMATGSNDVLVVRGCEGSIDKRERLLPLVMEHVVKQIDLDSGVIKVDWDPEF